MILQVLPGKKGDARAKTPRTGGFRETGDRWQDLQVWPLQRGHLQRLQAAQLSRPGDPLELAPLVGERAKHCQVYPLGAERCSSWMNKRSSVYKQLLGIIRVPHHFSRTFQESSSISTLELSSPLVLVAVRMGLRGDTFTFGIPERLSLSSSAEDAA